MSTKERILDVTAELFRRHGYNGTGLKQIVASANAPFGSIYHFFPGGKEELGEAVVRRAGAMYYELVEAIWTANPDPVEGLRDSFSGAAATLIETDYIDLCPIGTVALEMSSTSEPLRRATADVFEMWIDRAATRFIEAGVPASRARALAIQVNLLIQGAFMFARATRSTEAVEAAGEAAVALFEEALGPRRAPAGP